MPEPPTAPSFITVSQFRARFPISRTKAYALLAAGEIPSIRVGRRVLVSESGLAQWAADLEESRRASA